MHTFLLELLHHIVTSSTLLENLSVCFILVKASAQFPQVAAHCEQPSMKGGDRRVQLKRKYLVYPAVEKLSWNYTLIF